MNNIKVFFYRFCIMFTVITITYGIFCGFINLNELFSRGFMQCLGLAFLFSVVLTTLDLLSNKVKILSSNNFIWIQYLILVILIVSWALIFRWGNWKNIRYVFIFIGSFTLIYLFIYFFIDLSYKDQDDKINKQLKEYQKGIDKD